MVPNQISHKKTWMAGWNWQLTNKFSTQLEEDIMFSWANWGLFNEFNMHWNNSNTVQDKNGRRHFGEFTWDKSLFSLFEEEVCLKMRFRYSSMCELFSLTTFSEETCQNCAEKFGQWAEADGFGFISELGLRANKKKGKSLWSQIIIQESGMKTSHCNHLDGKTT